MIVCRLKQLKLYGYECSDFVPLFSGLDQDERFIMSKFVLSKVRPRADGNKRDFIVVYFSMPFTDFAVLFQTSAIVLSQPSGPYFTMISFYLDFNRCSKPITEDLIDIDQIDPTSSLP